MFHRLGSRSRFRAGTIRLLALSVAVSAVAASNASVFVWTAGLNNGSTNWYSQNWLVDGLNTGQTPYGDDVYLNNASDFVYTNFADNYAYAGTLTNHGTLAVEDGGTLYTGTDTSILGISAILAVEGTYFDVSSTYASTAYLNVFGGNLTLDGGTLEAFNRGQVFSYADTVLNTSLGSILASGAGSSVNIGGYDAQTGVFVRGNLGNYESVLGSKEGGSVVINALGVDNGDGATLLAIGEDSAKPGSDSRVQITANDVANHDDATISADFGGQLVVTSTNLTNFRTTQGGGEILASGADSLGNASSVVLNSLNIVNDNATIDATAGGQLFTNGNYVQNSTLGEISSADPGSVVNMSAQTIANIDGSSIHAFNGGSVALSAFDGSGSGYLQNDASSISAHDGGQLSINSDFIFNQNHSVLYAIRGGSVVLTNSYLVNDNSWLYSTSDNSSLQAVVSNNVFNGNFGLMYADVGGFLQVQAVAIVNDNSTIEASGFSSLFASSVVDLAASSYFNNRNNAHLTSNLFGSISLSTYNLNNSDSSSITADSASLGATVYGVATNDNAIIEATNQGFVGIYAYNFLNINNGIVHATGNSSFLTLSGYSYYFDGTGSSFYNSGTASADNAGTLGVQYDNIENDGSAGQGQIFAQSGGTANLAAKTGLSNVTEAELYALDHSTLSISAPIISNAASTIAASGDSANVFANALELDNTGGDLFAINGGRVSISAITLNNESNAFLGALGTSASGATSSVILDVANVRNTGGSQITAQSGGVVTMLPSTQQFYNDASSTVLAASGGSISA